MGASAALLAFLTLAGSAGCTSHRAASRAGSGSGWVDQSVSFEVGGVTVYGTYRRPSSTSSPVPAALLIAGSGPTDRNGNDDQLPHLDSLHTVANWLSEDGVASLRYDKLGAGQTASGPTQPSLRLRSPSTSSSRKQRRPFGSSPPNQGLTARVSPCLATARVRSSRCCWPLAGPGRSRRCTPSGSANHSAGATST
jgi:hypothetical protein